MSARFVEAALVAAGYDPGDRESNAFYRDRILPLEYDSLLDVAGANLRLGRPVVLDAPFSPYLSDPHLHHRGRASASTGRRSTSRWSASASPRRRFRHRLRERGLERDRVKLAHWDEYWAVHGGRPCAWTGVRLSELSTMPRRPNPRT